MTTGVILRFSFIKKRVQGDWKFQLNKLFFSEVWISDIPPNGINKMKLALNATTRLTLLQITCSFLRRFSFHVILKLNHIFVHCSRTHKLHITFAGDVLSYKPYHGLHWFLHCINGRHLGQQQNNDFRKIHRNKANKILEIYINKLPIALRPHRTCSSKMSMANSKIVAYTKQFWSRCKWDVILK